MNPAGKVFSDGLSGESGGTEQFRNVHQGTKGKVGCLQMRGEYMFVAEGKGGFQVYDIASIGNKGFSESITTAPFFALRRPCKAGNTASPRRPRSSIAITLRPG